jgi:acyl-CoA synthetase (AMP-forming)/AMP-acid ligase II
MKMCEGVSKGERIVLVLENSLEYVISYYGTLKIGAVAVPLSGDLKPDGVTPILREIEPKVVISSVRYERMLRAIDLSELKIDSIIIKNSRLDWKDSRLKVINLDEICSEQVNSNIENHIEKSDLASIIYTSGSTGTPKGVMLSHENIVSNTQSICSYLQLTENDVQMVVLPFFYVMGKSLLNTHFAVGGTVVLNNKFAYPAAVVQQMADEGVTGFSGVPSTYAFLLHRSPIKKYRDKLSALRYCTQAGGHMAGQIKSELRQTLPNHTDIFIMYGATEASARLTYLEPENFDNKMGSIGKPIPGVRIQVMNSIGIEMTPGEQGELVAAGPNVMQGYWKDPEATHKALNQDGYHTGDLGYRDLEGYLFLSGRKDNLLKVGGHRINPQEIEDVLMASGLLFETAVVGLQDSIMGSKLIALSAPLDRNCTENQLLKYCADRLPKHKIPSAVKMTRSIPKSETGKIDRDKCMEILQAKS